MNPSPADGSGRYLSNGRVKVSFRSLGDVDVTGFAHRFGGGGHKKAAGASFEGSMAEVQETVLKAAREVAFDKEYVQS